MAGIGPQVSIDPVRTGILWHLNLFVLRTNNIGQGLRLGIVHACISADMDH